MTWRIVVGGAFVGAGTGLLAGSFVAAVVSPPLLIVGVILISLFVREEGGSE